MFDDYTTKASEARYKAFQGEEIKINMPKQMLQRLPIAHANTKTDYTFENLLNGIHQII